MNWLECLNETFKTYAPLLEGMDKVIGIFISAGLFWLAHRANAIAKSNLELAKQERLSRKYRIGADEREIFRSCYTKVSQACGLVLQNGRVDAEASALFWQARDQARLELPDDIAHYTEALRDASTKAFSINDNYLYPKTHPGLEPGEERTKKVDEHAKYIEFITDAKPHKIFAPYMKVKIE